MSERSLFKTVTVWLLGAWLGLFVFLPGLLVAAVSFLRRSESRFVDPVFTGENYLRLLDPIYLQMFLHSLAMALAATLICLLLGYPFAFVMSRVRPSLRPVLLLLVIIPYWTNSLVRTYAIRSLLTVRGSINEGLLALGLIDEPLRLLYSGSAVTVGLVYLLLPFMILPLYANIEKLDRNLLEAAADLGAGRLQTFFRVVLPLTMPGIIAGCLLVFLPALGLFFVADLLGGARDLLIGNFIKNQFLDARDWPFGAAASVALIGLMALLLLALLWSRRRLGLKGVQ